MSVAICAMLGLLIGCGAAAESELQKERKARAEVERKVQDLTAGIQKLQADLETQKGLQGMVAAAEDAVKKQLGDARQMLEETRQKFLSAEAARVAAERIKNDVAQQLEQLKPLADQAAALRQQMNDLSAQLALKDKLVAQKDLELQKAVNDLRRLQAAVDSLGGDVGKYIKRVMPPETPPAPNPPAEAPKK
jgi:chromosome segregation ATPase